MITQGVKTVLQLMTVSGWVLLALDALPWALIPFDMPLTQSLLALGIAGVGSMALVTMRCQRPLDEVYRAAFAAGEQHERRRWLASAGSGEKVVPLRRRILTRSG